MKLKHAAGALALMAMASMAQAELTLTPTIVSDYDFRGISLSARDPAPQLSLDFAHDSGFGFGVWASNTDLGTKTNTEIDFNPSFNGGSDETFNWGVGMTYYTYVSESSLNYPEYWVGISKPFTDKFSASAKFWYSNDLNAANESGTYIEVNARVELPKNFGLELHAARSDGDYWDLVNGDGYTDFAVGLTYSWNDINFGLKYIDGSDLPDAGVDLLSTESKVVFSVTKSFSLSGKKE